MAKLGSYFALCPLMNIRNLLGIVEDSEQGNVIVTLSKNISIVYKVSDQKQIRSFRTKDKFTSTVVYEPNEKKYTAVFNDSYIRVWDEDEEHIDKQKKHKLNKPINLIIKCGSSIYVAFQCGYIIALNELLKNRKTIEIEDIIDTNTEYVSDIIYSQVNDEVYIGQIIANKENDQKYILCSNYGGSTTEHKKINLKHNGNLVGYCFEGTKDKLQLNLLTLWSDNKLFSYPVHTQINQENSIASPGNLIAIIEFLSCGHFVTMVPLNDDYIAMYGANKSEEGAVICIYNLQFKVMQSKQTFKMFTNGAKVWHIDTNLYLGVGQNLAVIPLRLETEQLAALIGSHKIEKSEQDPDVSIVQNMHEASWGDKKVDIKHDISPKLKKLIQDYLVQGFSVTSICEDVIDELISTENLDLIGDLIIYFNKMNEHCLVKILKFLINVSESRFKPDSDSHVLPEKMRPFQRCRFIDSLLLLPYTDNFLTMQIRKQLDLNESLLLLKYITYMLQENSHSLPIDDEILAEHKLIDWGNILLDANYVKFLLVKEDSILSVLNTFNTLVKEHLEALEHVRQALPIVTALQNEKYNKVQNVNLPYSVETIKLY